MNQSVVDRMSLVKDIELPEPEVMVQRAMAVTGCADEYLVSQMVQVVNDMADYCRKNSITDGALRNAQPDRLGHQRRDLRRPLSVGKVYGHQQSHCRRGRPGSTDYNHSGPYVCPKAEANIGISPEERRTTLYGKSES